MYRTQPDLRQNITDARVWKNGHTILDSGRHSFVRLDMERLLEHRNQMRLRSVIHGVAELLGDRQYNAVVPVPNCATTLLVAAEIPDHLPPVIPPSKLDKRNFAFEHPAAEAIMKRAARLAIFDDVLTTGRTSLAVASAIRELNPTVALDLVAIWCRDTLDTAVAETFQHQAFLIEETIPSWPATDCSCSIY